MATSADTKTFVKDGKERVAFSPADAVALRFDGWAEKPAEKPAKPGPQTKPEAGTSAKTPS